MSRRPTRHAIREIIQKEFASIHRKKFGFWSVISANISAYPKPISALIKALDQFQIPENTFFSEEQHQQFFDDVKRLSTSDEYTPIFRKILETFPLEEKTLSMTVQKIAEAASLSTQQLFFRTYWTNRTHLILCAIDELSGKKYFENKQDYLTFFSSLFFLVNVYCAYNTNLGYFFFKNIISSLTTHSKWNKQFCYHLQKRFRLNRNTLIYLQSISTFFIGLPIQCFFDYYYSTSGLFLLTYFSMSVAELSTLSLFQWLEKTEKFSNFKNVYPFTSQLAECFITDANTYIGSLLAIQLNQYLQTPKQKNESHHNQKKNQQKSQQKSQTHHKKNTLSDSEKNLLSNDRNCASDPSKCCYAAKKFMGLADSPSKNDIKKEYRRLSLLFHPDKCEKPDCEENFILLNQARNAALRKCL